MERAIRKADNLLLIGAGIIDLLFGILSLIFSGKAWQICSALASITSLVLITRLIISFPSNRKGNVVALVISILDVIAGILSVFLVIYGIRALAFATASLTAFKAIKITIQYEKFVKLGKTAGKKVLTKFTPLLLIAIMNKIKRGITKMKNKNITVFSANKMTIGFSSMIAVFSALIGWATDYILPIIAPNLNGAWYYVVVVAIAFVVFALLETAIILLGKDSKASYALSQVAKKIGLENALNNLIEINSEIEKKKEEEIAIEKSKAEAKLNAQKEDYKAKVATGYTKSFDEYLLDCKAKQEEQKKKLLLEDWKKAVLNGETKSFDEWCKSIT